MTRRRRRLISVAIASVLAGLVPPVLLLALSYGVAEREANQMLQGYAAVLTSRANEIFINAESTLSELALKIDRNCTDNSFEMLRKAVYKSLYFREAGLVYDNAVQCTSVRVFDPPIPITNPDHLVMPEEGIHISAPWTTLEGEVSIIVLYRVSKGIAVNLLLNPKHLTEPMLGVADPEHIQLRVMRTDGAVLASQGHDNGGDRIEVTMRSEPYPLTVTVSGSKIWLLREWHRNMLTLLGLGLVLSLPIFLMLRRFEMREQSMDVQIRDALEAGELRVYYQPVHSADGRHCVGAEALLRWQHPERGLILPSVFIPVAEETGFIVPLTHWLMRTVCAEMAAVLADHPDFYVAMNLSPSHFADPDLPRLIRSIFGAPFASGRLVFEVTERELMDSSSKTAREVIEVIRKGGARVALDDFGSGYSSLRYLAQFEFDLLKIDKAFIDAIGTESVTAGLVDDMLAMARRLGLKTIAEGVETATQVRYLQKIGVEYVQGWFFSEALPLDRLKAYLQRHKDSQ